MCRGSLLLLCLLAGCGDGTSVASSRAAILGGVDAGAASDTFLLELRFDTGSSVCSAVLVSAKTLLTAAHCVDPVFHGAASVMVRATNEPDTKMLMNSDMIDVTMMSRHPSWNAADQESGFDVAMLLLARAPQGVRPVALRRTAPAAGQSVEVRGYGRASAGDGATTGTRRSVIVPITSVATNTFAFGTSGSSGICAGDSGGPSFLDGAVAGVHSRTMSASCGTGVDIRVDRFVGFIDAFIAANDPPPCTMDGVCAAGCGMTDPDCRCVADGTCGASCGGADPDCCAADGQCVAGCASDPDCRCRADGACETGCAATDPDCDCKGDGRCETACGAADVDCDCEADAMCNRACGLSDVDCLDDGQVCADEASCVGARCLNDARGFQFCSRACVESTECQNEMTCQGGLCRAAPVSTDQVVRGGCSGVPVLGAWLVLLFLRRRSQDRARGASSTSCYQRA